MRIQAKADLRPVAQPGAELAPSRQFIDAFNMGTRNGSWDGVEIQFKVRSPRKLELFLIRVPRASREQGRGSKALSEIVKLADVWGVTIELEPSPADDDGPGLGDLVQWYERFGFVPGEDCQIMHRHPSNGAGAAGSVQGLTSKSRGRNAGAHGA
jgi:GNAT superfamily N-acetyltransferase